ncbi:Mu transposase domain-containing protein [Candidatus Regiella endosymbiont of Tuberolachnus salignus]|uniref:Mu transposase domain-containing protein n=1 Tax=Candidatus Regiella endosymbiont of Tuberolachnus salignus TaxID=3077956 RepID=UPI0030CABDDA
MDRHYYSVPHTLLKQKLEAHVSGELVNLFHRGELVAVHPRSHDVGGHSTLENHMPEAHKQQGRWTASRLEAWGRALCPETHRMVSQLLQIKSHPEQAYRACLGLRHLSKKYSPQRLNAACGRAIALGVYRLSALRSIEKGLDSQPIPSPQPDLLGQLEHQNIRGNRYYH